MSYFQPDWPCYPLTLTCRPYWPTSNHRDVSSMKNFSIFCRHPGIKILIQLPGSTQVPQVLLQTSPTRFGENFVQKDWPYTACCMQHRFHTSYNRPETERPTLHLSEQQQGSRLAQSSASVVVQDLPGFTMDLEQGGCYPQGKPPLISQMSVAPDRWDNSADAGNLQSECQQVEMELQSKLHGRQTHFVSEAAASSGKACIIEQKINTTDKCTSTVPCVASCGIMVGTPFTEHSSAFTQTKELLTVDKSVLTELSMSDLDYAAQEFSKLKVAHKVRKKKEKSLNQQDGKQCDCVGLAEMAKPSVLAQQYYMFQQYCSSGQLSDVYWWEKTRQERTLECSQDAQRNPRMDCGKSTNTSIFVSWERSATFNVNTAEENQSSACKELNTGEVWYDAEEDLYPASIPAEVKEQSKEMTNELAKEDEMDSGLDVPNIANNLTEKRLEVSNIPMPRATFVPQHYGTMVAFDTLMAELMHFHPGASKRCIVGALKELWDVYQSDLCTLPLSTVRQMASDFLNRPTNVTPP
ncbi:RNA-binding protein 44 isoform X3 [Vanacampus margaritifer]